LTLVRLLLVRLLTRFSAWRLISLHPRRELIVLLRGSLEAAPEQSRLYVI
jgi:hypothetical protein